MLHIGPRAVVAFGVAVGHPDPTDRAGIKPRLAPHVVHGVETYRPVEPTDVEAYERELAAYPGGVSRTGKYWPPVRRIDGAYGDRNLVCSCPSPSAFEE